MPKTYDIYERLARDYAKPRQYSGYSSGAAAAPAGPGDDRMRRMTEMATTGRDIDKEMEAGVIRRSANLFGDRPKPADALANPDLDYGRRVADIAAMQNQPMPEPMAGPYYGLGDFEAAAQQAYGQTPEQQAAGLDRRQSFLNQFRASMQGGMPQVNVPPAYRMMQGAAPIVPGGFNRPPESTFVGGRDYAAPQGPEQPGMFNALRARLGF